jgi:hypothetical protein
VPEGSGTSSDKGVTEALRAAIERTLAVAGKQAKAGSDAVRLDRATQLLDEVARRGREAGDELARRGQKAGAGLARRGPGARDELAQRLEDVERRVAALEDALRTKPKPKAED